VRYVFTLTVHHQPATSTSQQEADLLSVSQPSWLVRANRCGYCSNCLPLYQCDNGPRTTLKRPAFKMVSEQSQTVTRIC